MALLCFMILLINSAMMKYNFISKSSLYLFLILINELKQTNAVAFDFPVVDDTYPHLLQFDLNKPFDKVRYDYITQKSSLHKLSFHKKPMDSNNQNRQTFYHYIKHQFLNDY